MLLLDFLKPPLKPDDIVTDDFLRKYAAGRPEFIRGEISPDDQLELSMLISDICGELLAHRLLMRRSTR